MKKSSSQKINKKIHSVMRFMLPSHVKNKLETRAKENCCTLSKEISHIVCQTLREETDLKNELSVLKEELCQRNKLLYFFNKKLKEQTRKVVNVNK